MQKISSKYYYTIVPIVFNDRNTKDPKIYKEALPDQKPDAYLITHNNELLYKTTENSEPETKHYISEIGIITNLNDAQKIVRFLQEDFLT